MNEELILQLLLQIQAQGEQVLSQVGTDVQKLESSSRSATSGLNMLGGSLSDLGKTAVSIVAGGALLMIGQSLAQNLKEAISTVTDLGDQVYRLSTMTNMSAETASGWISVMERFNVAPQRATMSMTQFSRQLENLDRAGTMGTAKATTFGKALEDLGITAQDMSLPLNDMLLKVADGVKNMADGEAKTADVSQLFGSRIAASLLPILNQGSAGIEELTADAKAMGVIMGQDAANGAHELTMEEKTLGEATKGIELDIGEGAVPALLKLSQVIIMSIAGWKEIIGWVGTFLGQLGQLAQAIPGITGLGNAIGGVFSELGSRMDIAAPISKATDLITKAENDAADAANQADQATTTSGQISAAARQKSWQDSMDSAVSSHQDAVNSIMEQEATLQQQFLTDQATRKAKYAEERDLAPDTYESMKSAASSKSVEIQKYIEEEKKKGLGANKDLLADLEGRLSEEHNKYNESYDQYLADLQGTQDKTEQIADDKYAKDQQKLDESLAKENQKYAAQTGKINAQYGTDVANHGTALNTKVVAAQAALDKMELSLATNISDSQKLYDQDVANYNASLAKRNAPATVPAHMVFGGASQGEAYGPALPGASASSTPAPTEGGGIPGIGPLIVGALQGLSNALAGAITSFSGLPHFQGGGLATSPMLAMIGEVPEAIIPLSAMRGGGGGRSGDTYQISVTVAPGAVQVTGDAPSGAGQIVGQAIVETLQRLTLSEQRFTPGVSSLQPGNPITR